MKILHSAHVDHNNSYDFLVIKHSDACIARDNPCPYDQAHESTGVSQMWREEDGEQIVAIIDGHVVPRDLVMES